MAIDDYKQAMRYENLIRNAYNCQTGNRNGAHLSFMQNAMTMERGESNTKHLGSFKKQFEKVKTYISKALIKLSKTKPYSKESIFFNGLNHELEYSNSTKDLMEIVNTGLDKIIELKK
ncbi:MAG: hypothetical protein H6584_07965 [Flavobacteriales bacterium]|nr:hypothetical protein [Flavobacteriales bacterium]